MKTYHDFKRIQIEFVTECTNCQYVKVRHKCDGIIHDMTIPDVGSIQL